jgi:hypothetical protein
LVVIRFQERSSVVYREAALAAYAAITQHTSTGTAEGKQIDQRVTIGKSTDSSAAES